MNDEVKTKNVKLRQFAKDQSLAVGVEVIDFSRRVLLRSSVTTHETGSRNGNGPDWSMRSNSQLPWEIKSISSVLSLNLHVIQEPKFWLALSP